MNYSAYNAMSPSIKVDHSLLLPVVASKYFATLSPNDILLGRGTASNHNSGNILFRKLVSTKADAYNRTARHHVKDYIAQEIVDEITRRGGKFLKMVEANEETQRLGIPKGQPVWSIARETVILEKVKQALRDVEQRKKRASQSKQALRDVEQQQKTASQYKQALHTREQQETALHSKQALQKTTTQSDAHHVIRTRPQLRADTAEFQNNHGLLPISNPSVYQSNPSMYHQSNQPMFQSNQSMQQVTCPLPISHYVYYLIPQNSIPVICDAVMPTSQMSGIGACPNPQIGSQYLGPYVDRQNSIPVLCNAVLPTTKMSGIGACTNPQTKSHFLGPYVNIQPSAVAANQSNTNFQNCGTLTPVGYNTTTHSSLLPHRLNAQSSLLPHQLQQLQAQQIFNATAAVISSGFGNQFVRATTNLSGDVQQCSANHLVVANPAQAPQILFSTALATPHIGMQNCDNRMQEIGAFSSMAYHSC